LDFNGSSPQLSCGDRFVLSIRNLIAKPSTDMNKILVIEDDDAHRAMLKTALEGAGYEVKVAPDGEVGYHMFEVEPFDLVITDIIMPKQEGLHTIIELMENFPEVKIIVISGGGSHFDGASLLEIAKDLGADNCFEKPFKLSDLLASVKELLNGGMSD